MASKSLQEQFAPSSICFGCGPANRHGLRIRSFVKDQDVIAHWTPDAHHEAFPGVLNGGIIGTLLDCHSNWTAAWTLMQSGKLEFPPCTVTADFHIFLLRPTPTKGELELRARATEIHEDRVHIDANLFAAGKQTARCKGTFVAVKPGHPAYHRWDGK